jgi:hypothetical protein
MKEAAPMSTDLAAPEPLRAKPIAASIAAGLIASLCCGGSLIFGSIGLGAFYSTLGLARYIPQVLAAGAVSIIGINYVYYRHIAQQRGANVRALQQKMFISAAIGVAAMAGSFIFMEWLNHAVIHADRFLGRPAYGQALIKGVPDTTLLYVGATFFALAALWALPFPNHDPSSRKDRGWIRRALRFAVAGVTTVLIIGVLWDALPSSRDAGAASSEHGKAH